MISYLQRIGIGLLCLLPAIAGGQGVQLKTPGEIIHGPAADEDNAAWLRAMREWRQKRWAEIRYDGSQYGRPELAWAQHSFIQPQVMVEERYLYDPLAGKYTVDHYLDDLESRYGGIDSVLIWPVYPNIGIDNRNQHDLLHDMPGGLPGLRQMVADFHRRDVRVLFPVMPWDVGTRPEGVPLHAAAARDMQAIGADGINGDTMGGMGREFRKTSDDCGHPLVLEPENQLGDDGMVAWNNMSWGYWQYQPIPVVSKYKWIEPRHMVNVCERWAKERTDGLQSAFFNGVGYESWENVWGIWNEPTPRDAEAIRRIAMIQRAVPELLSSAEWQPHFPAMQAAAGVYASRFPGRGQTLWLLVNRSGNNSTGPQLKPPATAGMHFYDLWHGVELPPAAGAVAALSFEIEPHGYGAILAVEGDTLPEKVQSLLPRMRERVKTRLASLSAQWKCLPQKIVDILPTAPAKEAPEGMLLVRGGKYRFQVSGVEIEGGDGPGVDFQYPWEDLPQRRHDRQMDVQAFYIDKYPVSNAQFKRFLDASGYKPKDGHNFLRDWQGGSFPRGWDRKPVTWVSLEDARAYAAWAGKRLPHEWQWQYAAQGNDGRPYPWGKAPDPTALPKQESGRELRPPTDVDAYPKGASPWGVMDLVGNVWQWTDEYTDEHTRAAVVRGGSYYRPSGSMWYFPQNTRLDQHGKYLLIAPSKDRSAMLGFRCVVDAAAVSSNVVNTRADDKLDPPKPASRSVRKIEGWTVRVDDRLLEPRNAALGARALKLLEAKLTEITTVVAADRLAKLQDVTIVLDLTHGKLRRMQYHPSAEWLKENGYSADLAKCVHLPDVHDFVDPRTCNEQPWAVMHELAHSYHDQVLGFDDARILAAYERFKKSGHGDSVLAMSGRRVRHYALTDHKEFFAEMTEAYFGRNDFFPFNRAELMTAEPEIFALLQTIWGKYP
ncbi:MAG: SUMF1/EgtB/PvdO family nonheme iron enzyme [Thermoguttaceae bacterium]|jgi:formylglycine-generating enzyme required for sulfatase activity